MADADKVNRPVARKGHAEVGTAYYIAPWSWAGDENGLVASTRNMMRALSSVVPLLKTSIGMPAECPFIVWPAST